MTVRGDRDRAVRATERLYDGTRWCPEAGLVKTPGTRRRTAASAVLDRLV